MAEHHPDTTPTRSYKPIYWILVVAAFIALCGWAYTATRHSQRQVAQAEASGQGVGTAYDPTTGRVEGAGAVPGQGLNTGGPRPPTAGSLTVTSPPDAAQPANR